MSQNNHAPLFEDSFTLDHYMQVSKKETLALKKLRKETQTQKPERKGSTQLSIFSWLHKGPSQQSLILTLDKWLVLKVFGYLRLSELVVASQVCSYFLSCYRSLWTDKDFFSQLQTDKFTCKQLGRLIEKSSRLEHVRQLKQLYSGKNIEFCRQKIKLRAGTGCPNTGGMLELFSVTPKQARSGSTFILDSHLMQVVNTSFRSLKSIELVKCGLIKDFVCLSRCLQLTRLTISYNENFKNQDLGVICKRCLFLEYIHLQECKRLDENVFQHLQFVENLKTLNLRHLKQNFGKIKKLSNNLNLTNLDLEGSLINDIEALSIVSLKYLQNLSLKNCYLLTKDFIDYLLKHIKETKLKQVITQNCNFQETQVSQLQKLLAEK